MPLAHNLNTNGETVHRFGIIRLVSTFLDGISGPEGAGREFV